MARSIATNTPVELDELLDFVRPRHRLLLATTRRNGRPQISPVSGGVDAQGRIVISTYPARAKTRNAERHPQVTVLVLSDDWNGPWVQVDGDAQVLHMPEAVDGLVEYFRCRCHWLGCALGGPQRAARSAVAKWLAEAGVPAVRALDVLQPLVSQNRVVTFWESASDEVVYGTTAEPSRNEEADPMGEQSHRPGAV